jgi:hypothetical protein
MITLQNDSPFSMAPSVFKKMFKLPKPNLTYKGYIAKTFLKGRNNGIYLLQEYLQRPNKNDTRFIQNSG